MDAIRWIKLFVILGLLVGIGRKVMADDEEVFVVARSDKTGGKDVRYLALATSEFMKRKEEIRIRNEAAEKAFGSDGAVIVDRRKEAYRERDAARKKAEASRTEVEAAYGRELAEAAGPDREAKRTAAVARREGALKGVLAREREIEETCKREIERCEEDQERARKEPAERLVLFRDYLGKRSAEKLADDLNKEFERKATQKQ